jgi:hypothetical protein
VKTTPPEEEGFLDFTDVQLVNEGLEGGLNNNGNAGAFCTSTYAVGLSVNNDDKTSNFWYVPAQHKADGDLNVQQVLWGRCAVSFDAEARKMGIFPASSLHCNSHIPEVRNAVLLLCNVFVLCREFGVRFSAGDTDAPKVTIINACGTCCSIACNQMHGL